MYTNKRVLPPKEYSTDIHYRPLAQSFNTFISRRFDSDYAIKLALFLGVCILCYIFWRTIIKPISDLIKAKKEQDRRKFDEDEEDQGNGGGEDENMYK